MCRFLGRQQRYINPSTDTGSDFKYGAIVYLSKTTDYADSPLTIFRWTQLAEK